MAQEIVISSNRDLVMEHGGVQRQRWREIFSMLKGLPDRIIFQQEDDAGKIFATTKEERLFTTARGLGHDAGGALGALDGRTTENSEENMYGPILRGNMRVFAPLLRLLIKNP